MRIAIGIIAALLLLGGAYLTYLALRQPPPPVNYPPFPEVTSLEELVNPYLEDERTHALSIGWIEDNIFNYRHFGRLSDDEAKAPDSLSLYEIGSVTKTFTAAVLAEMVRRGKVGYDDPIRHYLPEGIANWDSSHRITLRELATHTSGMPRIPGNMLWQSLWNRQNPYVDYTVEDLYDFLKTYQPKPPEEREAAYSNLGFGLLGHLLARVEGGDYETLVRRYLLTPLDMPYTGVDLKELSGILLPGHDQRGHSTSAWDIPTLAGAGALRSNTRDMLRYVQAQLEERPPFPETHVPQSELKEGMDVGLAWIIQGSPHTTQPIIWHNGGTGGFRSFVGFDKTNKLGVVVLSNTSISVDEIGQRLLAWLYQRSPAG